MKAEYVKSEAHIECFVHVQSVRHVDITPCVA